MPRPDLPRKPQTTFRMLRANVEAWVQTYIEIPGFSGLLSVTVTPVWGVFARVQVTGWPESIAQFDAAKRAEDLERTAC